MKLAVCLKQVPSSNEIHMDPETHTIKRRGDQMVTNPFDFFALETAVRIRERVGGTVAAVTMGLPVAETLLRDALGRGADRGLLLTDPAFAGADTLATAYTLSRGIRWLGDVDLIVCGRMATDGDTAQIGPELAAWLDLPVVTGVSALIDISPNSLILRRRVGEYREQIVRLRLPGVITVVQDIFIPRMPTIPGVRFSLTGPVYRLGMEALEADPDLCGHAGSPTRVVRTGVPEDRENCQWIEGGLRAQSDWLAAFLREGGR